MHIPKLPHLDGDVAVRVLSRSGGYEEEEIFHLLDKGREGRALGWERGNGLL